MIANTWFKHPTRKLYTWKSPGNVKRNQIDYIMVGNRFSNLNWKQGAVVKTEKGLSDEIEIKRGVRQGCVMSPRQ